PSGVVVWHDARRWFSLAQIGCKIKTGPQGPRRSHKSTAMLLDFGFAEFDMLARDRVVLLLDQLVGHGARVLLGDVIEAGVRRGHELDLDGDRFGHGLNLKMGWSAGRKRGRCWRAT